MKELLKKFMGITNPRLTNKQVAIILWFGISAIIAILVICFTHPLPFWLRFPIIAVSGLNFLLASGSLPSSGINIKE